MFDSDPSIPVVIDQERYCIRCGYLLRGISTTSRCPECGTDAALSLRERFLTAASPEYLAQVRGGLSLVLNGILLLVVLLIASIPVNMTRDPSLAYVLSLANFAVSALMLLGYWRYTAPDPSEVAFEPTNAARRVVRGMVMAQVGLMFGSLFFWHVLGQKLTRLPVGAMVLLAGVMGLASLVVMAAQFFSVLRYTRWIATRIPDPFVVRRCKRYRWLLPVLYIVGAAVLMLGPLVALILYWNLLDRVRKHLRSIIATGQRAKLRNLEAPMP